MAYNVPVNYRCMYTCEFLFYSSTFLSNEVAQWCYHFVMFFCFFLLFCWCLFPFCFVFFNLHFILSILRCLLWFCLFWWRILFLTMIRKFLNAFQTFLYLLRKKPSHTILPISFIVLFELSMNKFGTKFNSQYVCVNIIMIYIN